MGEAVQAVAMSKDIFALNVVQDETHLFGRVLLVIEKRDEFGDGTLEVDVVLPKRVVGIDEQSLCAVMNGRPQNLRLISILHRAVPRCIHRQQEQGFIC